MYILQLSQGELNINVGLFHTIEEGRKLISQLAGYQYEVIEGFEYEYFDPTTVPDYVELEYNGHIVPLTTYMFTGDGRVDIYWNEIVDLSTPGNGMIEGSTRVDAYSIPNNEPNNILALSLLGKAYQILNDERSEEVYRKSHVGFKCILDHSKDKYIEEYCYYRLGKDYLYGTGTDVDYENAMFHFLQSQNQLSWYSLGQMYLRGLGIEKDEEKAFEYFLKSAKCSNPFALYETARCYELGIGCLVDKEKADYYYKNAYFKFESMVEENENDNLLYRLGMMNIKGKGVEQNIDLGIHFLQKAIDMDNEFAQIQMARILIDGIKVNKNVDQAISLLMKAEEKNNSFAQYMLGKLFLFGKEVEQDKEKAFVYLQKSASQGNVYAQYLIDNMERYEQQDIALMVSRFFYHISRIFEQQLPINNNNPLSHVDKKLRRKMQKKRSELGHKEDDQTLHF